MAKLKIIDGGKTFYDVKTDKLLLGDRYASDVPALSVDIPTAEQKSVCIAVVTRYNVIVDLIVVDNDTAAVDVKTNVTQYDHVMVGFNFIRPDGSVRNTRPTKYYFSPATKPEGFSPATPAKKTLAADLNATGKVVASLSDDDVLTVKTIDNRFVASVDFQKFISELAEIIAEREEEKETDVEELLNIIGTKADKTEIEKKENQSNKVEAFDEEKYAKYTDEQKRRLFLSINAIDGYAEHELIRLKDIDKYYAALLDDTNTSRVFKGWYGLVKDSGLTKYEILEKFFAMCAYENNDVQTVRFFSESVSSEDRGTPLDWLATHKAQYFATDAGIVENGNKWQDGTGTNRTDGEDWASENRQTWYIRANAIPNASGNVDVIAIEDVDDTFDATGEIAPVYVFQLSPYFKEYDDNGYEYNSWRANPAEGYDVFGDNKNLDGSRRYATWHPFSGGALTTVGGKLTSGVGRRILNYTSAQNGNTAARKWNAYTAVGADANAKWAFYEFRRRHFNKENSGIAEGCLNYNYQYIVAHTETGATRVLVTSAQAANFIVGSNVIVGDTSATSTPDRGSSAAYNLSKHSVKILSKEVVSVDDTEYTALNLQLDAAITTTSTTWVSTMPWDTGETEKIPAHLDGSPVSLTNGKYPLRVAGMEVLIGSYFIGLDVLYNVTANSGGGYNYTVYECKNASKIASSITSDYVNTNITLSGVASGWNWVKSFVKTSKPVLFPEKFGGSSAGYLKSAFLGSHSAGVRCPWRFGHVYNGDSGGLTCEFAYVAPSASFWYGAPWLIGAENTRGE